MPFPISEPELAKTEAKLGVRFPESFRQKMMEDNGGEVQAGGDSWALYPFLDTSDKKRLKRTCNDIARETQAAKLWRGFPANAVAIAANGGGDLLVLLPDQATPSALGSTVHLWSHETGELTRVAEDFGRL